MPRCLALAVLAALFVMNPDAEARPGRPSAAQVKKMKEEMAYRQREVQRVQTEWMAKEKELFDQFDENKDGRLLGPERSKYDKHREQIRTGKAPNPFATILPLGQGPRTPTSSSAKK